MAASFATAVAAKLLTEVEWLDQGPEFTRAGYLHYLEEMHRAPDLDEKTLVGAIKTTHDEMTIASIALAEVTKRCKAEMDAAQARFRTALAAHLQAITGEQVAP